MMLNCKQASHLVSQSMEAKLSFRQRLGLRVHLMMCDACTQFSRQLLVLREAISQLARKTENDETLKLSDEARRRIGKSVEGHAPQLDVERQHSDQRSTD
jgi:hypothetical protein